MFPVFEIRIDHPHVHEPALAGRARIRRLPSMSQRAPERTTSGEKAGVKAKTMPCNRRKKPMKRIAGEVGVGEVPIQPNRKDPIQEG